MSVSKVPSHLRRIRVRVRVYAELNDFLLPPGRNAELEHECVAGSSVKDCIEALGVPHTEIDLLLVNGQSAGFEQLLADGDRVSAFPVFETFDVAGVSRVRPEPLRDVRFVLDVHLGRLAALLRLAGFDAAYRNDWSDHDLADASVRERRILLTRDRALLKRRAVTHACFVRATSPAAQLAEVVERLHLNRLARPFSRCTRCNSLLEEASPEAVAERVPPRSRQHCAGFLRCPGCGRVYWHGSHHRRLGELLAGALRAG